jgi:hypothetical protein
MYVRPIKFLRRYLEENEVCFIIRQLWSILYSLCREHFAHLYGPATLIEDKKTLLLHNEEIDDELPLSYPRRTLSTRSSYRKSNIFPGVELRDKLKLHIGYDKKATTGTLRRAFSTNAYHKVKT